MADGLFAGIVELQLVGHPIQHPSLNHRHSSPVQKAPLLLKDFLPVRTEGSLLPKLLRGGGKVRPPCVMTAAAKVVNTAAAMAVRSFSKGPPKIGP